MKIKFGIIASIVCAVCILAGCRSNKEVTGTVATTATETVSLGTTGDGSIMLRAWGAGRERGEAIEQAKRNALRDVLFKGIKKGTNPGMASKALVPEVNAEEKYAVYFEPFFSPGGEYKNFVVEEPGNATRMKSTGLSREGYGVVVIVNRSALEQQLKRDGVLKQ